MTPHDVSSLRRTPHAAPLALFLAIGAAAAMMSFAPPAARAADADEPTPPQQSVRFDGRSHGIRLEAPSRFNLDEITLAAWIKLRSHRQPQIVFNRGERGEYFTLYLYKNHVRMLVEYQRGEYDYALAEPPALNEWTHLLGTYDGETIKLYVNGQLAEKKRAPGRMPKGYDPVYIGAREPGADVLDGSIADARIYAAALTADQARAVAAGGEPAEDAAIARFTADQLRNRLSSDQPKQPESYPTFANGELPVADGFRGIWYANQPSGDKYKFKYSGGLATYPQQHHPIAVYDKTSNKTFFVYGGSYPDRNRLLHMVSYYDHETGRVARPRILLDKQTADAHDNPTLAIDDDGYLWVFSNAHGTARPSYIHRSAEPRSITAFQRILKTNFSYGQPYHLRDHGFVFLHTRYGGGRRLFVMRSDDGREWSEPKLLAHIDEGHYQVSWPTPDRQSIGTAFNYHPKGVPGSGLNWRTNIYYMQTDDGGETWRNVRGEKLDLPLKKPDNPALALEYQSKDRLVYLKDVQYDANGNPIILYLTSEGYRSGPDNDPRIFTTARWTGDDWRVRESIKADNNYDFASLYVRGPDDWRMIVATKPSPQPYNTGGEVAVWRSTDRGESWNKMTQVTRDSPYNHNYPRRPLHYHDDFAALWADGHGRKLSESRLYFTDIAGDRAFRLPPELPDDATMIDPEPISN